MKKNFNLSTKILAIILSIGCMLTLFSGCGKKDDEWITSEIIVEEDVSAPESQLSENNSSKTDSDNKQSGGASTKNKNSSPDKLKNPNITVFWPMTIPDHPEFTAVNKAFEKKYGGKVTVVGEGDWD